KEVVTYAGLLARAHDEGLKLIETEVVQLPCEENSFVAVVRAAVETQRGIFYGIGDASPDNVNAKMRPHLIRMAETRAKARALRDAVNIGIVSIEELGDLNAEEPVPSNVLPIRKPKEHRPEPMTNRQRRLLFRLLTERGHEPSETKQVLLDAAGVEDVSDITKAMASELIDQLKNSDDS
ncbi:MAG: hypothetical protein HN348_36800, partial [Proteobacteria bacterium]|nr:hypothetical protein [Pseudomonadota bacterium]